MNNGRLMLLSNYGRTLVGWTSAWHGYSGTNSPVILPAGPTDYRRNDDEVGVGEEFKAKTHANYNA